MKFTEAVQKQLSKSLKRIRIKVDPRFATHEHFKQCNGYEGYILDEDHSSVQLMVLRQGMPIVTVPVEALVQCDKYFDLKTHLAKKLKLSQVDPLYTELFNCKTMTEVECILSRLGIEGRELSVLYLQYIDELLDKDAPPA